jgi:hypothetical protein
MAVSRHGVRGIGSLAVAYGGALAVRCALSVCCIAPNYVVYVVYPHNSNQTLKRVSRALLLISGSWRHAINGIQIHSQWAILDEQRGVRKHTTRQNHPR